MKRMKRPMSYPGTGRWVILLLALVLVLQGTAQAQDAEVTGHPPVETYLARASGPNLKGEVPPLDRSRLERPGESQVIKPTEMYLVPVSGPNLTGEVPPLDKSRAIALHEASGVAPNEVPDNGTITMLTTPWTAPR